ncbi:bifunctional (p)ppGpp synthetase/guanosine-3',5'-bis(diphosphate) 3'-pyrophosphohydrolase [candidate division KSB1 bacterium]|nr:bifunctional (p)ppGpp synthetase/guanosine-3',5'-bis(diphosphate) 3'-pyrophosphohydrolase [candidate division KSB1 bacterium]
MTDDYNNVIEGLLRRIRRYNSNADIKLLKEAFEFSFDAHKNQTRQSGDLYFDHPLEVAKILTNLKMDYETIAGGILHDIAEDTPYTIDVVKQKFGDNIAQLVDGVTKISGLKYGELETQQAENFRKMLLSMVRDIRVILIKFADRLHNMRTLQFLPESKRRRIALETREVYAPLAHRLGLARIKGELEDLSFKFLEPDTYLALAEKISQTRNERETTIRRVTWPIRKALSESKVQAHFAGRAKHFFSIYSKIKNRGVPFDEIYDLLAIRIIVEKIEECYHALGIVHSLYTPIHERFKDYIATPKSNGYQSLHTTIVGPDGQKVEIQIRTEQMHRTAEEGIAAHWRYKEGRLSTDDLDRHMVWLRQVLDWFEGDVDNSSFMDHLKINLFQDEVFVFTPKGDLHRLPIHATSVDFAFSVHTDVGLHCLAAKVNGSIVPLSTELRSGDTVEILTSGNQKPNKDWLQFVVTSRARAKIKKWLRDSQFESSVELGAEMLNKAMKKYAVNVKEVDLEDLAVKLHFNDIKQLLASLGRGDTKLETLLRRILPDDKTKKQDQSVLAKFIERARKSTKGIRVAGMDNIMINFGKCCNPVPGEPITGIVTTGRGIVIHTNRCKNLHRLMQQPDRIVDVSWDVEKGRRFLAGLYIIGERKNKLLTDISETAAATDCNIVSVKMDTEDSLMNCVLSLEVYDLDHLKRVMGKIKRIPGVAFVDRLTE